MLKYLCVLAVAMVVSGCGGGYLNHNLDPAPEPKDGPRARFRGVGGNFDVDQNVCGDRPDLSQGHLTVYRSLGMPRGNSDLSTKKYWGEMYIRADQQVKVHTSLPNYANCGSFTVYFNPEEGRDYEFNVKDSGHGAVSESNTCTLTADDITVNPIRPPSKPLKLSKKQFPCN